MARESVQNTFLIAGLLAVVCSALVSTSAVLLRPLQAKNQDLDRKKNILQAAGIFEKEKSVEEQFEKFEIKVVDLATGEFAEGMDVATFDQRKAARSEDGGVVIAQDLDLAGIKRRSLHALVYIARDEGGKLQQLILPVHGKGLWSTLYGYLALDADLTTISGFAFYEHGETPGLGADIEDPDWLAEWVGKRARDEQGRLVIGVAPDEVDPESADFAYTVDGLTGATRTCDGVTGLLRFWLGDDGFGPFLERIRS
jgi:Na+-transporting NADH:ubiquinone oxidoreductase subunit C